MRKLHFACMIPALVLVSAPALAQEAADKPVDNGDIIVTANRTESLASKTPVALTAVSGTALVSQGITNPTALAETVPNLSIDAPTACKSPSAA